MSYAVSAALYQKTLQLIILPTEKCNFRCTYCYETFEIGKMKPPVVEAVKKLIAARMAKQSLEALYLSWFGGEPLLAKDVMLDIATFANEQYTGGNLKAFVGDVTTNGYLLTPDVLADLVALKQSSYQVSLDGFGAAHDVTRRYASGKGTFDTIWANLLAAKRTDLDFRITLRCHMTRENEEPMRVLIENICKEFGHDQRFNVFFKPIENLGGPNAKAITTVERPSAHERVKKLNEMLREVNLATSACLEGPESNTGKASFVGPGTQMQKAEQVKLSELPANKLASFEGYICYAAKPNSLMIRADGTIGKCTVLMDDPRNRVGKLNDDGTVTLDSELVSRVWMRGFASHDSKELGCPAQNLPKIVKTAPVTFVPKAATAQA